MMPHILFLTPQMPYPPHQGTALRNYGLISGLFERGFQVSLLTFREADQPQPEHTPLSNQCVHLKAVDAPAPRSTAQRLRTLLSGQPDMAVRLRSAAFEAALISLLQRDRFDFIHIEGLEMAPYLPLLRASAPHSRVVFDAHNAEASLQQRIAQGGGAHPRAVIRRAYSQVQAARLGTWEARVCAQVDQVLAVSQADAAHLHRLAPSAVPIIIPNALRMADYAPELTDKAALEQPALMFTGKLDYRPNIDAVEWFTTDILPAILTAEPAARFYAVGKNPAPSLLTLEKLPGVAITGFVPEIQPYLAAAAVYVAPLRAGSGTRLKLLEAMAMGCAVVTTPIGAEGLNVLPGEHLLLAEDAASFARAVTDLLAQPAYREHLGRQARQHVAAHYDWHAVLGPLEKYYIGE